MFDLLSDLFHYRCKFGDWFSCPWYMSLGMFFFKQAHVVNERNNILSGSGSCQPISVPDATEIKIE